MEKINSIDDKFNCFVNEIRKDKDWINLKKSFVRAPQILKHKVNIGENMPFDDTFDGYKERFKDIKDSVKSLEKNIQSYSDSIKQNLNHSINLGNSFKDVAKLTETVENQDGRTIKLCQNSQEFIEISKSILKSIEEESNLIIGNVKTPLARLQLIMKNINFQIKEREFHALDTAKYLSKMKYLEPTDKKVLTLKQEQNLIRYTKNYELSKYKYQKLNEIMKVELQKFFSLVSKFIGNVFRYLYYLQLTISHKFLKFEVFTKTYGTNYNVDAFHQLNQPIKNQLESLKLMQSSILKNNSCTISDLQQEF